MKDPRDTPSTPGARPGRAGREPEQLLIDRIRDLLDGERLENALRLFNELHPVDQGDVLVDLPPTPGRSSSPGCPRRARPTSWST